MSQNIENPGRTDQMENIGHTDEQPPIITPERYFDGKRFNPGRLADDILRGLIPYIIDGQEYHVRFISERDRNGQIYVSFDGYYYRPEGEAVIDAMCKEVLGEEYRKNRATEVIANIRASTYTDIAEPPVNLINLKNGVFDLNTGKLFRFDPKTGELLIFDQTGKPIECNNMEEKLRIFNQICPNPLYFFNQIPVEYNPEATCPQIDKFLDEITASKEDKETLLEFIGYCLYRKYPIAKALFLIGEGANGKSTFLNLLKAFLGPENISNKPLQDLVENRFAISSLRGKLANIYADLSDRAMRDTGYFKMLTGQDTIEADRKFLNTIKFENYAKLIFSANTLPFAMDDTYAFYRRFIIIEFPYKFEGEKADTHLLEKLTTPQELSGLLNLVIPKLKSLLERGTFTLNPSTEITARDYIRKSNPVKAFCEECLTTDPEGVIIKKDLYAIFCNYCASNKSRAVSQDTFFKALPRYLPPFSFRETRIPHNGERVRAYAGISLSEKGKQFVPNEETSQYKISAFDEWE